MNIQLASAEGLVKTFKVVVPANDLKAKKDDYIKSRASRIKVDGFRPGKAPAHVVEQRLGGDAFNHALRVSIDESIKAIRTNHVLKALGEPEVDFEEFKEGQDLAFSVKFELLPDVESKDLSHISLEKLTVSISEKEIQDALNELLKRHKAFEAAEGRKVAKGDRAECIVSFSHDDKKVAGYQNLEITVAAGDDNPFLPELKESVLGKSTGDAWTFDATFPENFGDRKIAGKTVSVSLKLKTVLAPKEFALDDTFAKEFKKETFEELRQTVKDNLASEYNNLGRLYVKRHLLDALESAYDFLLPESMVKNEFNAIWPHLQNEINAAKEKGETIDNEGKTDDEIRAEYEKISKRRVKLGLVISHISQEEKIQLTQDDLRNALIKEAMRYPGQESQVMEYYRKNPKLIERLAAPLLEDKVVDFLMTKIQLKEVELDVPALKEKVKGVIPTFFDDEDQTENAA